MTRHTLTLSDLRYFTGSENGYRHPLNRRVVYTDGARYVAEAGGAYWLLDEIALAQLMPEIAAEAFQVWTLRVQPGGSAELSCGDGNKRVVFRKELLFTDFPLSEIALWYANGTIYLPSEH